MYTQSYMHEHHIDALYLSLRCENTHKKVQAKSRGDTYHYMYIHI